MQRHKAHKAILLALACGLTGCVTTTTLDSPRDSLAAKARNCPIDFFIEKSDRPQRDWTLITKAESHIKKNVFFGGRVSLRDDALDELREKACTVGADAVIVEDYIESSAAEYSDVHVWAAVVRYTSTPAPAN